MTATGDRHRQHALPVPEKDWALFLDLDGTISEIAPRPDAAVVHPNVVDSLADIERALDGALALVSGRSLDDLDRLVHPLRLAAAGQHGAEWRLPGGRVERAAGLRPGDLDALRAAFRDYAGATPGVVVEEKGLSVSIHFRQAPSAGSDVRSMADRLIAGVSGYHVSTGKGVVEIRPDGIDKGAMIEAFLADPPFAGRRPVFAGDDVTDEDGFATVNRLGGISIRIGAETPEQTEAKWYCAEVVTFTDWLTGLSGALGGHD